MKASSPSWQSTLFAITVVLLAGGIFLVVFLEENADEAIKVWGALGTLVGAVIGAVPAYFFGQQGADAAREEAQRIHDNSVNQVSQLQSELDRAHETARNAQTNAVQVTEQERLAAATERAKAEAAEDRATQAEQKVETLLGLGKPELAQRARELRSDLNW